jgi:hypothetical protein
MLKERTSETSTVGQPERTPKMHSSHRVRLLGSALRARGVHLRRLAAAGAMLTCFAVILNVGPFAKAPKMDGLPGNAVPQAARAITEQPVGSALIPRPEIGVSTQPDRSQAVMKAAEATEPIRPWIEPSSISVVEVTTSASQPITPKVGDGEIEAKPPRQDIGAADPPAPPHEDRTNPDLMKKATIVGVWAPNAGTCSARDFRERVLPAVINTDGAWAGETFCIFKNKNQTERGWRVVAECSNPRERWTANVQLTVNGDRLTWTSKRGTQTYTRCATDVLIAEAR